MTQKVVCIGGSLDHKTMPATSSAELKTPTETYQLRHMTFADGKGLQFYTVDGLTDSAAMYLLFSAYVNAKG